MLYLQERGNKQLGRNAAFLHFVALTAMIGVSTTWLWQPTGGEPYLCRAENMLVGIVYALAASQLIMAHMSKEPFRPPIWAIFLMAVAAINAQLKLMDPLLFTLGLFAIVFVGYLHYVFVVIGQICEYLDINCLTIKHPVVVPTNKDA